MGINDSSHFLHKANDFRESSISVNSLFKRTENKRSWGIINPGFILAQSYMYFVFGYENNLLNGFSIDRFIEDIKVESKNYKNSKNRSDYLLRRLRNSIAHSRVDIIIISEDGKIHKDGDVHFIFEDNNKKKNDYIKIDMDFSVFANLIEESAEYQFKELEKGCKINT